jgi:hypothetical protein
MRFLILAFLVSCASANVEDATPISPPSHPVADVPGGDVITVVTAPDAGIPDAPSGGTCSADAHGHGDYCSEDDPENCDIYTDEHGGH